MEIISNADTSLQPQDKHITGDWRVDTYWLEKALPAVTVKINEATLNERIYGRNISSNQSGHFISVPFSLHVWAENATEGLKASNALNLADKIVTYLLKYVGDDDSGIRFFYDLTTRESEPERGPQRMSRVIIEGFMFIKRPLS